jgi:hypothetical protein
MTHQKSNCNCCECIWERILLCAKKKIILKTKRGIKVKYKVERDVVVWLTIGPNQNVLYNQTKMQICACLTLRNSNQIPSQYPGYATSYKWALLNHECIWLVD